mmetsp:Transcript_103513/g.322481  ORF Transcript_103513/g.322481 Transcript_103513/m.322481 type:complete len:471 (-) Transcript_103513:103-1515(-)
MPRSGPLSSLAVLSVAALHPSSGLVLQSHQAPSHAPYFWSSGRGSVGSYSASPHAATFNISKPTWTWHDPKGEWATFSVGTAIDDKRNIYLTVADGIHKFSPDGQPVWKYTRRETGPYAFESISKAAALMDGFAYCITMRGRAFAVSMETGEELWSTLVAKTGSDGNYGQVAAHDGVIITAAEVSGRIKRKEPSCCGDMNHKVVGLSASDGRVLWRYTPDIPIWNFGASFVGDGTFIYQDLEGRVHRNRASDGSLVWKAGGVSGSWTDGQANLGPNGLAYGVANYGNPSERGCISAYRVSDGEMLWRHDTHSSPNSVPAVGRLAGSSSLSVVIPIGENDKVGAEIDVLALDAETGAQRWLFRGPKQTVPCGLGDSKVEARDQRARNHISTITLPNSWGCTAIDGSGTAYVGGTTGHFFALRDADGDGAVAGPQEVSVLATPADIIGSSGPALAPGLLAVGNAQSLMVWRY